MKKLNISEMEAVNAGLFSVREFTAGYCAGVSVLAFVVPGLQVAGVACALYGFYAINW